MIVNKYAKGGGGGSGSTVSYEQTLSAGTETGKITINGNTTTMYAPEGGGETIVELTQAQYDAIVPPYPANTTYIITDAEGIDINDYQEKLEAGENITISGNTISAEGGLKIVSYDDIGSDSDLRAEILAAPEKYQITFNNCYFTISRKSGSNCYFCQTFPTDNGTYYQITVYSNGCYYSQKDNDFQKRSYINKEVFSNQSYNVDNGFTVAKTNSPYTFGVQAPSTGGSYTEVWISPLSYYSLKINGNSVVWYDSYFYTNWGSFYPGNSYTYDGITFDFTNVHFLHVTSDTAFDITKSSSNEAVINVFLTEPKSETYAEWILTENAGGNIIGSRKDSVKTVDNSPLHIWRGTESEYNNLAEYDDNVLYIIKES